MSLRIWDQEGEIVVTLTDVDSVEQFKARVEVLTIRERAAYQVALDTPFFAQQVDDEEDVQGIEQVTETFAQWFSKTVEWAEDTVKHIEEEGDLVRFVELGY